MNFRRKILSILKQYIVGFFLFFYAVVFFIKFYNDKEFNLATQAIDWLNE